MPASFSRRDFLIGSLAAGTTSALQLRLGRSPRLRRSLARVAASRTAPSPKTDRSLVLCTLSGGSDGLNVVVPYEESAYYANRGGLAIQPDAVLEIGAADGVQLGLHPALVGIQELFQAGQVAIVMGVGYPNPSFSHFQSMDIWQTGDPSGNVSSGWLGRWLDTGSDILRALSVGVSCPTAFSGARQSAGTLADTLSATGQGLSGDRPFVSGYTAMQTATPGEALLAAELATGGANFVTLGSVVEPVLESTRLPPPATARPAGDIGTQLDLVAELMNGGLPTLAYGVLQASYDTHADQLATHALLLAQLDAAVTNFFAATAAGSGPSPVMVVYSEFGRRVPANASAGTDHGTANNVLVIGPDVKGGFYGALPSLASLDSGNLRPTTDYRSVYATLIPEILGIDAKDILGGTFPSLGFLA
jgi:uncharacterized protein (DUF1501 family)